VSEFEDTREIIERRWWVNETIRLDGYKFVHCRFVNCEFRYATADFEFENCLLGTEGGVTVPLNIKLYGDNR